MIYLSSNDLWVVVFVLFLHLVKHQPEMVVICFRVKLNIPIRLTNAFGYIRYFITEPQSLTHLLHDDGTLQWRHDGCHGVSNHRGLDCLLNRLFSRRSKETSKLRVTGLCEGNSPMTGEVPAQRASNAENVSIWWRHHEWKRMVTWTQYCQ